MKHLSFPRSPAFYQLARHRRRIARVPGWPMSSQRATSTCPRSNSNSGSRDTDSIMPPTPLAITTAPASARTAGSAVTSAAVARTQNSSSSGPGSRGPPAGLRSGPPGPAIRRRAPRTAVRAWHGRLFPPTMHDARSAARRAEGTSPVVRSLGSCGRWLRSYATFISCRGQPWFDRHDARRQGGRPDRDLGENPDEAGSDTRLAVAWVKVEAWVIGAAGPDLRVQLASPVARWKPCQSHMSAADSSCV